MATGIDNLGQSLLVGRDQGRAEKEERKEAQRRTRARERDQAARKGALLTLGGNLLNSYFANKYEDFSKREELQIAKRLADQNKKERDKFESIATLAQEANLTVPEYFVQETGKNYENLRSKNKLNSFTLFNNEANQFFETIKKEHVNAHVFGENYKVGNNDTIDADSLMGKYNATKEALKGVSPEDFTSSADLLKQMQESNPNAKNVQQKFLRLLNFKGMNSNDRREASESLITANLDNLKSRNVALKLFNEGYSLQDSVGIGKADEEFREQFDPLTTKVIKEEQSSIAVYLNGESIQAPVKKITKQNLEGKEVEVLEPIANNSLSLYAFNQNLAGAERVTPKKTETGIFGEQQIYENRLTLNDDGTANVNIIPISPPLSVESAVINATVGVKGQENYTEAKQRGLIPESVRNNFKEKITDKESGEITIRNEQERKQLQAKYARINVLSTLLTASGYFPALGGDTPLQSTALAATMIDTNESYKGILSFGNASRKFMGAYNEAIQDGVALDKEDFENVEINPFVTLVSLDKFLTQQGDPEQKQIAVDFINSNRAKFGLEGDLGSFFEGVPAREKAHMSDIVQELRRKDNSIFNSVIDTTTKDGQEGQVSIGFQLLRVNKPVETVEEETGFNPVLAFSKRRLRNKLNNLNDNPKSPKEFFRYFDPLDLSFVTPEVMKEIGYSDEYIEYAIANTKKGK